MAKLVRVDKPGGGKALGRVGGKLVTDADGAPCCCGDEPPPTGVCPVFTNVCDGQGPFDLGTHYRVTATGSMDMAWSHRSRIGRNPVTTTNTRETIGNLSLTPVTVVADVIRCGATRWVCSFGPIAKSQAVGSQATYVWDSSSNPRPPEPLETGTIDVPLEPGVHDAIPNNGGTATPPASCRFHPKWADVGAGGVQSVVANAAVYTDENSIVSYFRAKSELTGGCQSYVGDVYNPDVGGLLSLSSGWTPHAPAFGASAFFSYVVQFGTPPFFANTFSEFALGNHTVAFSRTANSVTRTYRSRWDRDQSWGITYPQQVSRYENKWLPILVSETFEANVSVKWERILPCTAPGESYLPPGIDPATLQPYTQPGRCAGCGQ